ncbi:MAG TPA: hypothetical protein VFE47_22890 [Tepidisphaeraceae bacterium]|nr:hypothetical protein [Tepidisphaeraceae bacterium]
MIVIVALTCFAIYFNQAIRNRQHGQHAEPYARAPATMPKPVDEFEAAAAQQIALLPECELVQSDFPGGYDMLPGEAQEVAGKLLGMGPRIIPLLVPSLADTRKTKTLELSPGDRFETRNDYCQVNQVVAWIIRSISERDFRANGRSMTLEIRRTPDLIPQYQSAVLAWYKANGSQTELQRKLADLEDPYFRNQLDAVEWLGRNRVVKGGPAIARYIDRTVQAPDAQGSSLQITELSESVFALGKIGDRQNLPAVQKACRRLSAECDSKYGHMDVDDLGRAYHGLAMLGEKQAAITELTRLNAGHAGRIEVRGRKDLAAYLDEAKSW